MKFVSEMNISKFNLFEKKCIADKILFLNEHTDDRKYKLLFPSQMLPGTFTLSEIKTHPSILYPEDALLGYDEWVDQAVRRDLDTISLYLGSRIREKDVNKFISDVMQILEFEYFLGGNLCELIPYQIYTDVLRRIISFLATGNPITIFHTYSDTNKFVRSVCLEVLDRMSHDNLDIISRFKRIIVAGLVGLNLKDSAAATSPIVGANIIPLSLRGDFEVNVISVVRELSERIKGNLSIDFLPEFLDEIIKAKRPTSLCFFTDDMAETIFDLDFIQELLFINPNLIVNIIPRRYNFTNDASLRDLIELSQYPYFSRLSDFRKAGRVSIIPDGPTLGAVDPRSFSKSVTDLLIKTNFILVKGARAYEMLQGIKPITYFAFSVAREFSESVTGLNAQKGEPVLIRQSDGDVTFQNFKARAWRKSAFENGRVIGLAQKTAIEYFLEKHHR